MPEFLVTVAFDCYAYKSALIRAATAKEALSIAREDLKRFGKIKWSETDYGDLLDDFVVEPDLTERFDEPEAINQAREDLEAGNRRLRQIRAGVQLHEALTAAWDFIENVGPDTPDRNDRFFALREQVRNAFALCEPTP